MVNISAHSWEVYINRITKGVVEQCPMQYSFSPWSVYNFISEFLDCVCYFSVHKCKNRLLIVSKIYLRDHGAHFLIWLYGENGFKLGHLNAPTPEI